MSTYKHKQIKNQMQYARVTYVYGNLTVNVLYVYYV